MNLVCRVRGHIDGGRCETLPEDGWGLYAISKMYCGRCGQLTETVYPFHQLAAYNAEVGRGIVHTPETDARMAIQQEYWREWWAKQP